MLLGAAKYLANTRNFKGSIALIFQPAEEDSWSAKGRSRRGSWTVSISPKFFGMHNVPGLEVGKFDICDGPIVAALDEFDLVVKGRGGHAAKPH